MPDPRRAMWLALLVAGAFFMENLDGTVLTTALPAMAVSFGVRPVDLSIGVSAYLLTLGVFIPISGWAAERFGARRVFCAAVAVFTAASALCGLANRLPEFVLFRVLQGIGGAMMVPVGRLVVLQSTPKERLLGALATLTWPALAAPVLGPPVGGFITTHASWRWIFYLNLPLGLVALVLAWRLVPEGRGTQRRPFDWLGFALLGPALLCLMGGIELGVRPDVPTVPALAAVVLGLVLLALGVRHLRRAQHPMFGLAALKVPTFAVAIWGGSLFRMSVGAVPFLLPLMFQIGFGYDAFHAGLLMMIVFAGNLSMKVGSTWILRRFGFKRVLLVNGTFNAAALLACAFITPATPTALVAVVLFFGGLVRSMQFSGLNTLAYADVPAGEMASANTLFSTGFQLAMGLGVALGAVGVHLGQSLVGAAGWGDVPALGFRLAFVVVSAVAALGLLDVWRLAPTAGEQLARKPPKKKQAAKAA